MSSFLESIWSPTLGLSFLFVLGTPFGRWLLLGVWEQFQCSWELSPYGLQGFLSTRYSFGYSLTSAGHWYPAVRGSQGGGVLGLLVAHFPRESPIPFSV